MDYIAGFLFFIAVLLAVYFVGDTNSVKSIRSKMTKRDKILVYITVTIVLSGEFLLVVLLNIGVIIKSYAIMIFCVYPLIVIISSTLFYFKFLKSKKK